MIPAGRMFQSRRKDKKDDGDVVLDSGDQSASGLISFARNDRRKGNEGEKRKSHRVKTAPAKIRLIRESQNPWYEVTLIEGKNRQIRRMFEEIGHHVEKIKRVRYGPLSLDLPPGEFRRLSIGEVEKLKAAAELSQMRRTDGDARASMKASKRRTRMSDPHEQ